MQVYLSLEQIIHVRITGPYKQTLTEKSNYIENLGGVEVFFLLHPSAAHREHSLMPCARRCTLGKVPGGIHSAKGTRGGSWCALALFCRDPFTECPTEDTRQKVFQVSQSRHYEEVRDMWPPLVALSFAESMPPGTRQKHCHVAGAVFVGWRQAPLFCRVTVYNTQQSFCRVPVGKNSA